MSLVKNFIVYGLCLLVLSWLVPIGYYSGKNYLTVPAEYTLLDVNPTRLKAGESFAISYNVRRNWTNCQLAIDRILEPAANSKLIQGQYKEFRLPTDNRFVDAVKSTVDATYNVMIPTGVKPGQYLYIVTMAYECNFVHRIFGPSVVRNKPVVIEVL